MEEFLNCNLRSLFKVGPKDLAANQVTAVLRCNGKKLAIKRAELVSEVKRLLEEIHVEMYNK